MYRKDKVSVNFPKFFKIYKRRDFVRNRKKITGYFRNDYALLKTRIAKYRDRLEKADFFLKQENFNLFQTSKDRSNITANPNSFEPVSRYFYFFRRFRRYQKLSSLHYKELLKPLASWTDKWFKRDFTKDFWKYTRFLKQTTTSKDFFFLRNSKEGRKISYLYKKGRIPKGSFFSFRKRLFRKQINLYKGSFHNINQRRANLYVLFKKLKLDYAFGYKPAKKKKYPVIGFSKLWAKLIKSDVKKYLDCSTTGQLNRLIRKAKYVSEKISSGSDLKIASKFEFMLGNLVFKLKLAPNISTGNRLVEQGFVAVDGKIIKKPHWQVSPNSIITFKRNFLLSYLFTIFSKEDSKYTKKDSRRFSKHSVKYLSRFRIPSYLEVSCKLGEALVLRNSFYYEQPFPFLIQKTNIPILLRKFSHKKGAVF